MVQFTSSAPMWKGLDVNQVITYTPSFDKNPTKVSIAEGPPFLNMTGTTTVTGIVKLPAGYWRVQLLAEYGSGSTLEVASQTIDMIINTPPMLGMRGTWRVTIFNENGGSLTYDDSPAGAGLVEQPYVRREENAPTKAAVKINNANWQIPEMNILGPSFKGWSDGHVGPIKEGMQMVIEYKDSLNGSDYRVFNDTIKKIEGNAPSVDIYGYDCILALSTFRDPILVFERYSSGIRSTSQENVIGGVGGIKYEFPVEIKMLQTVSVIDIKSISDGNNTTPGQRLGPYQLIIGHTVSVPGNKITEVTFRTGINKSNLQTASFVDFEIIIYDLGSDGKPASPPLHRTNMKRWLGENSSVDRSIDCNFEVVPNKEYFIGLNVGVLIETEADYNIYTIRPFGGSSTKTPSVKYMEYQTSWLVSPSFSIVPHFNVKYELDPHIPISPGSVSIVDDIVHVPASAFPAGSNGLAGAVISQFADIQAVGLTIKTLIERVGLSAVYDNTLTKIISAYDTSTHDYLACIHELLGASSESGDMIGIQASVIVPNEIRITKKKTADDQPDLSFSTSPVSTSHRRVVSHGLKKAFESYVTRPMMQSKDRYDKQIAMQTDDLLYGPESVDNRIGRHSVSITTDNSIMDLPMMSIALESQINAMHRNAIDGSITLDGCYPTLWSSGYDNSGGSVVRLDIPQHGPMFTAVARIIEFGKSFDRTTVTLDNIRADNRNAVNTSINRTNDNQTHTMDTDYVYLFARYPVPLSGIAIGTLKISLLDMSGVVLATILPGTQNINETDDNAGPDGKGYKHIVGIAPPTSTGYATTSSIRYIKMESGSNVYVILLPNPKNAWENQGIVVSVRSPKA